MPDDPHRRPSRRPPASTVVVTIIAIASYANLVGIALTRDGWRETVAIVGLVSIPVGVLLVVCWSRRR